MRKYAVVDNNVVVEVLNLDEAGYIREASYHQLIIDVEDLVITPAAGWILTGNTLAPAPGCELPLKDIIMARIKVFQDAAPELLRDLYAQNTLLGITVQQSDALFEEYHDVLVRLREGAWPTALYRLSQKAPSGFVTQEMLDNWTATIVSRMG